jgi:[ribosomal protein S18]-alanine N-acetyltransferase
MGLPATSPQNVEIRDGMSADLEALYNLENRIFETDRMSRRALRRLLASPSAVVLVAQSDGDIAGVAIVVFRANSRIARLYSIGVAPQYTGRGIARALLTAAETAARARRSTALRLEVHEKNSAAIKLYRKSGYYEFGRHHQYYQDSGHALRFEKKLMS